jgi:hypothetical protein
MLDPLVSPSQNLLRLRHRREQGGNPRDGDGDQGGGWEQGCDRGQIVWVYLRPNDEDLGEQL